MRDCSRVEYTFPVAHHACHVALGPPRVHSYTSENVDHAKTSLSDGKEKVYIYNAALLPKLTIYSR